MLATLIVAVPALGQSSPNGVIHYQGRLMSGGAVFDGVGEFKFALVNEAGNQVFWSNALDTDADGEPNAAVSVPVQKGLYEVYLGDASIANMAPIPLSVFSQRIASLSSAPTYLRVWFREENHPFQRLIPDQRISAVSFAMSAAHALSAITVPDAAITAAKLAPDALQASAVIGTFASSQVPNLDAAKIATGTLDPARLPANVALKEPDLVQLTASFNAQIAALQAQIDSLTTQVESLKQSVGESSKPGVRVASTAQDADLLGLGYEPFSETPEKTWTTGSTAGEPSARWGHAAVWVPEQNRFLLWGGQLANGSYLNSGAWYSPDSDEWQTTVSDSAPSARRGHTLVWDGQSAIVWGGNSSAGHFNTGARLDPGGFFWRSTALSGAPSPRSAHIAQWFPPYMVVIGGRDSGGIRSDAALYHSANDQWTPLALAGEPEARFGASSVAGTDRILIWGGNGNSGPLQTGAQLIFQTSPSVAAKEWKPISTAGAPSARSGHTAVMAGTRMLIWGGRGASALLGDGAIYDPSTDSWQSIPSHGAPTAREHHSAVWTGREMLIVGGQTAGGTSRSGAAFDPVSGTWRSLAMAGNPMARTLATTVWSGSELLTFGGLSAGTPIASLQRLDPRPVWHFYRKP